VRETDAASWIPLVLRNEPNVRAPGGTKSLAAASGDQEEAMWRSCCASATDLSFLRLDCPSSLWGADPP
jgi:hypothetical protein